MPLLNYTTEVPATRSIADICAMLQEGGAIAILMENDANREISAISFKLNTTFGEQAFSLPANVAAVQLALNAQIMHEQKHCRGKRKIPRSFYNNKAQATRIAWRIVKDWLEAQLAIHQLGAAKLEQVMIPFSVDATGKTFYARLVERGNLLLQ